MDVLALICASIVVGLLIILVTKAISSLRQGEAVRIEDVGVLDNADRRQRQPVCKQSSICIELRFME